MKARDCQTYKPKPHPQGAGCVNCNALPWQPCGWETSTERVARQNNQEAKVGLAKPGMVK